VFPSLLGGLRDLVRSPILTEVPNSAKKAGGRPAYVEEIAGVVGMLCSHDSRWCTGQVVCANGGMRMAI